MEYQYRLLEPKEDYKEAVIEKAGITASFTIAEVEAMQARNEKGRLEAEGQIKIEEAKIANIDHFHPEIKDMAPETMGAAAIYLDAKATLQQAEKALETCVAAIAENDAMIATVKAQFDFQDPVKVEEPVISPIQPDDSDRHNPQG